jgi:hypothetical protein
MRVGLLELTMSIFRVNVLSSVFVLLVVFKAYACIKEKVELFFSLCFPNIL